MSGQKNYPDRGTDRRIVSTIRTILFYCALGGLDKNILRGLRRQVDFVRVLSLYFFLAVETQNGITRLKEQKGASDRPEKRDNNRHFK